MMMETRLLELRLQSTTVTLVIATFPAIRRASYRKNFRQVPSEGIKVERRLI